MPRLDPRPFLLAAVLTIAAAGPALACLEHIPERILGFQRGSAALAPEHLAMIRDALKNGIDPTRYRVEVRGYADYMGASDPATWDPAQLKLAQDRALAVSQALRAHGVPCVERVALGIAPFDAQKAWKPASEEPVVPGVVIRVDSSMRPRAAPMAGVPVEKDCGRESSPSTKSPPAK
jgi:hypothetical protein